MRVPVDLCDRVLVTLKGVDLCAFWESHVEDCNRLIGRASGHEHVELRVERECVDCIAVDILDADGWPGISWTSYVYKSKGLVVRDGAKQVLATGMELDIVDDCTVVGEVSCWG